MEKPKLIVPITKSPHPKGRIGPEHKQDWYRGLVKAKELLDQYPDSRILVVSAFHCAGSDSEADIYERVLQELKVPTEKVATIRRGFETLEMMEVAKINADRFDEDLHFISTWTHRPRVGWIASTWNVTHHTAWGIPRPYEAITDLIMTFAYPVIDMLGGALWFQRKASERRRLGKF